MTLDGRGAGLIDCDRSEAGMMVGYNSSREYFYFGRCRVPREMTPSDDEKVRLFRDSIYYEIIHTFGVPAELKPDQLEDHAIGEAINFSRHVHARLLSQFLWRRRGDNGTRPDDLLAADFHFDPAPAGMSDGDRKMQWDHPDLNKGLLHLTFGRVRGTTSKPWRESVLKDLLPVTIAFMTRIRDHERTFLQDGRELFADQRQREGWATLLDCLERCRAGHRLRFQSGFGGDKTWYLPHTEEGDISSLYGTQEMAAPEAAVLIDTATNTVTTRRQTRIEPQKA